MSLRLVFAVTLAVGLLAPWSASALGRRDSPRPSPQVEPSDSPWSRFAKAENPDFTGQYSVASDPSVIRVGGGYRMAYTGLDPERLRTVICAAVSPDGRSWDYAHRDGKLLGLILQGRDGAWDENLEGPFLLKQDARYLLYYSGYRDEGDPLKGFPAVLSVAESSDGVHFERLSGGPVLSPTPGWYDNDAIYSPTIVRHRDQYVMIYVGHCYTDHSRIDRPGVYLLAATSEDGIRWTKREEPVMSPGGDIGWMSEGGAEPSLLAGPDGYFYLFFTGLKGEQRWLGVARSRSPYGPWQINEEPILTPGRGSFDNHLVLAPSVLLEGNTVRMWYLGVNKREAMVTGYAEASWPLFER